MWRHSRRISWRMAVGSILIGIAALLAIAWFTSVNQTQASQGITVVKEGSFPDWSYQALREEDGFVLTKVRYDDNSVAGIKAYAKANEGMAQRLIARGQASLEVEITFRRLLSADEFREVITRSGVPLSRISTYHMRAIGSDGQWLTMGGTPTNSELISQAAVIDRQMANIRRHVPDAQFQGVAYLEATITPDEYQRLLAHESVFMIDVTKSEIRVALQGIVPINGAHGLGVLSAKPFWAMQRLGLENFR